MPSVCTECRMERGHKMDCTQGRKSCSCPKCNCFSDLVHVPVKGEFFVQNGKIRQVIESEKIDRIEYEEAHKVWVTRNDG